MSDGPGSLVAGPTTDNALDALLSTPSLRLIDDARHIQGDLVVLGAGGKMGPSLCMLAANALQRAGNPSTVTAVSRFSDAEVRRRLEAAGVRTHEADLLNDDELASVPDAPNVMYMAGRKFETSGEEHLTWAMNSYLPGRVARRYRSSRIVVFSTGNVYPFVPVGSGGADERTPLAPIGEYAQSCLARERMFENASRLSDTKVVLFRLNYAVALRYGVLTDLASAIVRGEEIPLSVPAFNAIWQTDANEYAIRSLLRCESPPRVLNATGPETISVRWVAESLARRLETTVRFGDPGPDTALLANASAAHRLFGYPEVALERMIDWTAGWLLAGGTVWDKPTKFHVRHGAY